MLGDIEPRLLALDEEPRRVLRAASLYGDRFEFEAVLALMGLRGRRSLETALSALIDADLIRRAGRRWVAATPSGTDWCARRRSAC